MSMLTRVSRTVPAAVAAIVLVIALVAAGCGGSSSKATSGPTTITVTKGKPDGGIHNITVNKDDTIHLTVSSKDTTSEVHFHGYDVKKDMSPGTPAVFAIKATIPGVYEVELEDTSTQIAKVEVNP